MNLSPPGFRLVIASRIRPALPLSNLRVHNELNEISVNQLRFDATETSEFMHRILKLDLTPRQLADLVRHSEGWAAGLQLASLSLRDPSRRDRFISTFSGSLRDIADYLTTDVLNQQSPEVRDFLLRTSVLDRLNAGVCDALTKSNRGQELLELLKPTIYFWCHWMRTTGGIDTIICSRNFCLPNCDVFTQARLFRCIKRLLTGSLRPVILMRP